MVAERYEPVFVTWRELSAAMSPLHLGVRADVDRLHDIWMQGAPSADSLLRAPKGYDPRVVQAGNVERRLMLYLPLARWVMDVSARRGHGYTLRQALSLLHGRPDYGASEDQQGA